MTLDLDLLYKYKPADFVSGRFGIILVDLNAIEIEYYFDQLECSMADQRYHYN